MTLSCKPKKIATNRMIQHRFPHGMSFPPCLIKLLLIAFVLSSSSTNGGVLVNGMQVLERGQFLNSLLWITTFGNNSQQQQLQDFWCDEDNPASSIPIIHQNNPWLQGSQSSSSPSSLSTLILSESTDVGSICRNGALVPEQAIPGAYNQVCMTMPEREIPLVLTNNENNKNIVSLKIQQEASGSGRTGMAVWNSGLVLTRLLTRLQPLFSSPTPVLELGCGTGLVSIAASKLWQSAEVIATDGNPDVVRLAQRNIEQNIHHGDNIRATVLPWGLLDAVEYSADLVLGADLTYNSGSWRVLAETMSTILNPSGCVVYVSLGHEGFNVNPEMDGFLSVAREVGGLVPVSELKGIPINDGLLKDILTPTEARQVQSSGGVRVAVLQRKEFLKRQAK